MTADPGQLSKELDETHDRDAETAAVAHEADLLARDEADLPARDTEALAEGAEVTGDAAADAASRLDASKLVLGGASAAALGLLVWRISRRRG